MKSVDSDNANVPNWVKIIASGWADGILGDDEFLNGIQYLLEHGIIKVKIWNCPSGVGGICSG